MSQLTRQDIAEVVEGLLDRKLDERFRAFTKQTDARFEKFAQQANRRFEQSENRADARFEAFSQQAGLRFEEFSKEMDEKLERQAGLLIEHFDNKCDGLAEAIQVVNASTGSLARQSDLQAIKYDIKTIKVAVQATNDDLWR